MNAPDIPPSAQDLGYFYDTLHGRIALDELPDGFHPALKSALSSKALARLKRISQLGHTSVSFFSATHTRFSHAIGTMLVMNKLFRHVHERGLSTALFKEVTDSYPRAVVHFGNEKAMVHCHLLLAALYQDVGELPFQKVTSLHFAPVETDIKKLANALPRAAPRQWNGKKVFSVLSLARDMENLELKVGFSGYDFEFMSFLLTGDGAPSGATAIYALLQMVDGVIDADRLDYVYRDASVTIGSLSRPITVLESIVGYEVGKVIVNDPRPATDFLSTRMRLWTFVYSSADVRFRQVLLKSVLDGRWDRPKAELAFKSAGLDPELTHDLFVTLDDNSLMDRIEKLDDTSLEPYRQRARGLLLRGTLDYECRVLKRPQSMPSGSPACDELPTDLFFDLLLDHGHHQLHRPNTVFVRQGLTSRIGDLLPLEESAGAFSPLFSGQNSAMLVPDGFYLFLPQERQGGRWPKAEAALDAGTMYPLVAWEDARRSLACPSDTRSKSKFPDFTDAKAISISFCSKDFPTVVRVVRELHRQKRRYWLFLNPFDGTGSTPSGNSSDLITKADAVLAVVSAEYLRRATDGSTYINLEVGEIQGRSRNIPVAAVGADSRDSLSSVPKWNWGEMCYAWRNQNVVIPNQLPLKDASEETIRAAVDEALKYIDSWKKQP